jgi:hypothetical protein
MKTIIIVILAFILILSNWNRFDEIFFGSSVCSHTDSITLISKDYRLPLPPSPYNEKHCVKVGDGITKILVPVHNPAEMPELIIQSGCSDCGDISCPPLVDYKLAPWEFSVNPHPVHLPNGETLYKLWTSTLQRAPGSYGCCVSIELGFKDLTR